MGTRIIYWTSDGAGLGKEGNATVAQGLHRWIVAQGDADLIVYGGDVYDDGTEEDFEAFFSEMGGDVSKMCETPGNHDWHTRSKDGSAGKIPTGYESFWSKRPSRQPIDQDRLGGGRYEHVIQSEEGVAGGWQLIFLDTGECNLCGADDPWPRKHADERVAWLEAALSVEGRRKIVFAHHSRLSYGGHGDNEGLKDLWHQLFDKNEVPRVALTVGGHDHNVSIYAPRDRHLRAVADLADGIPLHVNGAGGASHSTSEDGTAPEFHDDEHFCVTRIVIQDEANLQVQLYSFGFGTGDSLLHPQRIVDQWYSFGPGPAGIVDQL